MSLEIRCDECNHLLDGGDELVCMKCHSDIIADENEKLKEEIDDKDNHLDELNEQIDNLKREIFDLKNPKKEAHDE